MSFVFSEPSLLNVTWGKDEHSDGRGGDDDEAQEYVVHGEVKAVANVVLGGRGKVGYVAQQPLACRSTPVGPACVFPVRPWPCPCVPPSDVPSIHSARIHPAVHRYGLRGDERVDDERANRLRYLLWPPEPAYRDPRGESLMRRPLDVGSSWKRAALDECRSHGVDGHAVRRERGR